MVVNDNDRNDQTLKVKQPKKKKPLSQLCPQLE